MSGEISRTQCRDTPASPPRNVLPAASSRTLRLDQVRHRQDLPTRKKRGLVSRVHVILRLRFNRDQMETFTTMITATIDTARFLGGYRSAARYSGLLEGTLRKLVEAGRLHVF